nr:MAG TPA: hypothetical protein [Crassvirales sp.]
MLLVHQHLNISTFSKIVMLRQAVLTFPLRLAFIQVEQI